MAGLVKRNKTYYAVYRVAGQERRRSLETGSYQIAKERLRRIESSLAQGGGDELPTRTRIDQIVEAYVLHIRSTKAPNGVKVDTWYLRSIFSTICPALEKDKQGRGTKKRESKQVSLIAVTYIEQLTTALISEFISDKALRRGIAPKTANRYREILMRLISWAMSQRGVHMPGDKNPSSDTVSGLPKSVS